jgi:hypothetical protein
MVIGLVMRLKYSAAKTTPVKGNNRAKDECGTGAVRDVFRWLLPH